MKMKTEKIITVACITAAFFSASAFASPYMGDPVELVTPPNGAITNKKLLDRLGDFNRLKPTIKNPTNGYRAGLNMHSAIAEFVSEVCYASANTTSRLP